MQLKQLEVNPPYDLTKQVTATHTLGRVYSLERLSPNVIYTTCVQRAR